MNHRKHLPTIACLFLSLNVSIYATETNVINRLDEVSRCRKIIVIATAQAKNSGCRNASMVIDNLEGLWNTSSFCDLRKFMTNSWCFAVSNLDDVADSDMAKTILLCSSWDLSDKDFVNLLNLTACLVEERKLDPEIFWWCQNPFAGRLSGFLVRNYADTNVQAVIIRSRKIFRDNPRRVAGYNSMLTGESRTKLEQFERAMEERDHSPEGTHNVTTRPSVLEPKHKAEGLRPPLEWI